MEYMAYKRRTTPEIFYPLLVLWWANKVQAGGEWDYKKYVPKDRLALDQLAIVQPPEAGDVGNENYAATGNILGLPRWLLHLAGSADEIVKGQPLNYLPSIVHILDAEWWNSGFDQPHDYRAIERGLTRAEGYSKSVSAKIITDSPGLYANMNLGGGGVGPSEAACTGTADLIPPTPWRSPGGNTEGPASISGPTVVNIIPGPAR